MRGPAGSHEPWVARPRRAIGLAFTSDPAEMAWLRQLDGRVFEGEGGYSLADAPLTEAIGLAWDADR